MNREYVRLLRLNRIELVSRLQRIPEIVTILSDANAITEKHSAEVLASDESANQCRNLISVLNKRGPQSFAVFLNALEQTDQTDLLELFTTGTLIPRNRLPSRSDIAVPSSHTVLPVAPMVRECSSPMLEPNVKSKVAPVALPCYPISSDPKGYVLIVNIEHYQQGSGATTRTGSAVDVENLLKTFTDLGYRVVVKHDPDGKQLIDILTKFSQLKPLSQVDACIVFILAHGLEHHVIASDGIPVSVEAILSRFTNTQCPYMFGKPKMIVIQACRGHHIERGVRAPQGDNLTVTQVDHSFDIGHLKPLPHMSDCVIVYSTLPGVVSLRSEITGTFYVKHFSDVFNQYGSELHVLDLLTEVNNRLVDDVAGAQISQPSSTLRKPFFLRGSP